MDSLSKNSMCRNAILNWKGQQHYSQISPYFQAAQFESNVLIHLISYVMHVVAFDLDDQWGNEKRFYNETGIDTLQGLSD